MRVSYRSIFKQGANLDGTMREGVVVLDEDEKIVNIQYVITKQATGTLIWITKKVKSE
jgi:ATP-dependent RNA circularization protein (DNA/RNA ligase family)